jgi:hypothetical protein
MSRFSSSLAPAFVLAASFLALAGCSSEEADVTLQPADVALTDQGGDKLFSIAVTAAPQAYETDKIVVRASAEGVPQLTLAVTFDDKNADKKLDAGEAIVCAEPADNAFGPSLVGKEVKVAVVYTGGAAEKEIATATWKPTK